MQAVRYHGLHDVRYETVPTPIIQAPDHILIEPWWCGICGSDLGEYVHGPSAVPTTTCHPITKEKCPVVLGHEFAGYVIEVGSAVTKIKPGDKVCSSAIIRCEKCYFCKINEPNKCVQLGFLGLSGFGGGMSQRVVIPQVMAYKLPDHLDLRLGALMEPLAVSYHGVMNTGIGPGQTALVLGAGPIGLCVLYGLKIRGVSKIIVSEPSEQRRKLAEDLGALTIDPAKTKVSRQVKSWNNGIGADASFDCSGVPSTLDDGLTGIRPGGTFMILALIKKPTTVNFARVQYFEKSIKGGVCYTDEEFEEVINAVGTGVIDPSPLITSEIHGKDADALGFKELARANPEQIKILVTTRPLESNL
ncbi:hypothetical protein CANCADRAFT_24340 [Tortispora caseinolytica NRRL Y-17796]|uniref:Enoyl reductase (ER) domain-containing protein n=1 Tax=Tortispora caseinolytica NRRL Y-17796 TaxID=767744 RepID=A0A1E4TGU3_9ASCO|nr:hypothetical protein CANCADRAFT_24340 [Tortispora caseinolytica NRRL Y-17796]